MFIKAIYTIITFIEGLNPVIHTFIIETMNHIRATHTDTNYINRSGNNRCKYS